MISSNYKGMILLLYCSFDRLKLSQKLRGEGRGERGEGRGERGEGRGERGEGRGERGEGRGEGRGMMEVVD